MKVISISIIISCMLLICCGRVVDNQKVVEVKVCSAAVCDAKYMVVLEGWSAPTFETDSIFTVGDTIRIITK